MLAKKQKKNELASNDDDDDGDNKMKAHFEGDLIMMTMDDGAR